MGDIGLVIIVVGALLLQRQVTKNLDRVRHSTEQLSFAVRTVEMGRKQRRDAKRARRTGIASLIFWLVVVCIVVVVVFLNMLSN